MYSKWYNSHTSAMEFGDSICAQIYSRLSRAYS